MKKCFCGKEAQYYVVVTIEKDNKYKYCKHYRCEDCKERALRSYVDVQVEKVN